MKFYSVKWPGKAGIENEAILSQEDLAKMKRGAEDRFYDSGLVAVARGHAGYVWMIPNYPGQEYTLTVFQLDHQGQRKILKEKKALGAQCVSLRWFMTHPMNEAQ